MHAPYKFQMRQPPHAITSGLLCFVLPPPALCHMVYYPCGCLTFELLPVGRTLVMGINISYDMEASARCISDVVTLPVEL